MKSKTLYISDAVGGDVLGLTIFLTFPLAILLHLVFYLITRFFDWDIIISGNWEVIMFCILIAVNYLWHYFYFNKAKENELDALFGDESKKERDEGVYFILGLWVTSVFLLILAVIVVLFVVK